MAATMAIALGAATPASAAAPSVDLWAPASINVTLENGTQGSTANHIYAMAIVRHDVGTNVNGVRFDLVHSTSGGNYGGGNCGTTAFVTCSGSYVGNGGWNNVGGRGTNAAITVRELPGQAASTTNTNSNYSQVWIDITPPNFDSWQNDGPDGTNVCGIEGGTRLCANTASFSFRLSDGQTTADQTMKYWTVSESDGSGEDFPAVFATSSTNQASVTAGGAGAVSIGYTCDDNDSGGGNSCDSAVIRFRRVGDNAIVNPGASSDTSGNLTCANAASGPGCETRTDNSSHVVGNFNADDNTARAYTFRAPRSRGLYVIEASFCNDDGFCPHGTVPTTSPTFSESTSFYGQSGTMWQHLGSFYVNDASPTVSFGTTTQTGGSTVAQHPTTGALHPNTGTTLTFNATTSSDTQVIDWNLDQNNTNGINASGYETRTYGTMSYSSSAGTPTVTKTATLDLSGYTANSSCAAAVRVFDTGGVNATDITATTPISATRTCTTNKLPGGTGQSGINLQRGTTSNISVAAQDADNWTNAVFAGAGGDEVPTINVTQPATGTVTCGAFVATAAGTGTFPCSYTVAANTTPGAYSWSYTITDSHAGTSAAATINGSILNTPPTATGTTRSIQRGTAPTFNLNGTDPTNGDTIDGSLGLTGYFVVSTASMPAGSSVNCTTAGACTVSIARNTTPGSYSFLWNVRDNNATSTTATETVTVTNTAPVANAVTVNDQRGRPAAEASFNLDATDAVNGDNLTYTVVSTAGMPAGSTVNCSSAGACTVAVPSNTTLGNYSFTYKANDNNLDSNTATVTVGVGNTTPVANAVGVLHTTVGAALAVTLDGTDFNGDTLTYAAPVSGPSKGNVSGGSSASRTYTASNGTKGNDSFTYTASDNGPSTSTAGTVSIIIDNTAPTAAAQTTSAPRHIATGITLAGADVNSDSLTFAVQATTTKGSLSCDSAGACTYTSNIGATGDDSFTFVSNDGTVNSSAATVTIHITNSAPRANAQSVDAPRRVPTGITLTGTDPNGDTLTFTGPVSGPAKGSVTCDSAGACSYTSNAGQTGTDSFTFTVDDGSGGTDTATVTINLTNTAPVAAAQTVSAVRHVTTAIQLGATDANFDTLAFLYSQPAKGDLTCDVSGACTYRSHVGESGSDSFTFEVGDGMGGTDTATVTINLTNSDPVANGQNVSAPRRVATPITLGATDPNSDTISYTAPVSGPSKGLLDCTGPSCTYTSAAGQSGTDSFTFTADDGFGGTDTATVTIDLTNSDPTADAQATSAAVHVATPITLTGSDPNFDTLAYAVTVDPTKGAVTCDAAGACSYRSNTGATGTDHFTFSVDDGHGGTDTAVVDVSLSNTKPVANPQTVDAQRRIATPITLTGSDPNDDALTFTGPVTGPAKGTLSCTGASCSYTSSAGQTGTDSFTFTVDDGNGEHDTATVTINLTNTAPTANAGTYSATKNIPKTFALTGADANGDTLTYSVITTPTLGNVSCAGAGGSVCTYTATALSGVDTFTFVTTDAFGGTSAPATVTLNIALPHVSVGDAQVLEPDTGSDWVGVMVPITLSAPVPTDVTVRYYTQNGTATGGVSNADYRTTGTPTAPLSIKIPAGQTWNAVAPLIMPDNVSEPDETFQVKILSVTAADGSNIGIGDTAANVTIVDNYRVGGNPLMLVQDSWIYEGDTAEGTRAQFSVQFSRALTAPLTIGYRWSNGTALEGAKNTGKDWMHNPNTTQYTIPTGTMFLRTVDIVMWGDTVPEDNETLSLQVVLPDGAPIIQQKPAGTLTILNDD